MPAKKNPPAKKPNLNEDTETEESTEETEESTEESGEDAEAENRRINAIVTNRVKREMKGVLSQLAAIQESLKSFNPKKTETEDESDDTEEPTAKKAPEVDKKTQKQLAKLQNELAEEQKARKQAEAERAQEADKAKRNEMRDQFKTALADHGVTDPRLMRAALDQLEQDGYMIRDEDGKIRYKGADKYGIETLYDPKIGLKTWVQAEGKSFIPAVDAGGSGTGQSRSVGSQTTKGEYSKMSAQQKAAIEIDRASQGLPPLGE